MTTRTPRRRPADRAQVGVAVIATVVFLTAIAPLATDMYVPAFPAVAADWRRPRRRSS